MSVIVVGAGMGGLSAAVALAARGVQVDVVEAGPREGGKAGIAVIDGVEVDTGPSVLTMVDVFEDLFARAGTRLQDELTVRRADPACRYVFASGLQLDVFDDAERSADSVRSALGSRAGDELIAFLHHARRVWEASAPAFVYGPAPTALGVAAMGPAAWLDVLRIDAFRSMDAGIRRYVRTPELAWILRRYATYNGSDPRAAPGTLNCIAHVELGLGVYTVDGGIFELARALRRVAERNGARFHFNAPVSRLDVQGGRVVGVVHADGSRRSADAVVCNADARHVALDLLPGGVPHRLPTEPEPSTSGWVGILRATRRDDRAGHTVYFPPDYDQEFIDLFDRDRPPQQPTVYVCAQERCHRRAGWADAEPVFLMANAPAEPSHGPRPHDAVPTLRSASLDRLVASGHYTADDALVWERGPAGLAEAFPGTRGAIYGSASNDRFAAFRRPPNAVHSVPGLFLASGSSHPGGGLPLCALSGLRAAEAVLARSRP